MELYKLIYLLCDDTLHLHETVNVTPYHMLFITLKTTGGLVQSSLYMLCTGIQTLKILVIILSTGCCHLHMICGTLYHTLCMFGLVIDSLVMEDSNLNDFTIILPTQVTRLAQFQANTDKSTVLRHQRIRKGSQSSHQQLWPLSKGNVHLHIKQFLVAVVMCITSMRECVTNGANTLLH